MGLSLSLGSASSKARRPFSLLITHGTRRHNTPERGHDASEKQGGTLHEFYFDLTPAQVNA